MEKEKALTPAEWRIMDCLWRSAPLTLMQLVSALKEETDWRKSTIATLLGRMEEKDLIRYETNGRTRQYFPCLAQADAAMKETASLLDRAYQGSLGLLVSTMVENRAVSKEELADLQAILQKAEEELS